MNKKITVVKPRKITIDTLGKMINNGFKEAKQNLRTEVARLEDKIDSVYTRVDGLEQKVGSLGQKIGSLEQRVDEGFQEVNQRIDVIVKNRSAIRA